MIPVICFHPYLRCKPILLSDISKNIHIGVAKQFKQYNDKIYDFSCLCVKGSINHGWIEISEVLGTGEVSGSVRSGEVQLTSIRKRPDRPLLSPGHTCQRHLQK